eukprot:Clim_evm26s167 gene=Clim_evmTU26s167
MSLESPRRKHCTLHLCAIASLNWTAGIIVMDRTDSRVNSINREFGLDLKTCVEEAELISRRGGIDFLVIASGKENRFVLGADISSQLPYHTPEEFSEAISSLQTILNKIEDIGVPTFAVINGEALGGGLEIAMACDYRLVDQSVTQLGLPEAKLGLVPGVGGCTRLPRFCGFYTGVTMCVTGKIVTAREAKELGLVTALLEPGRAQAKRIVSSPRGSAIQTIDGERVSTVSLADVIAGDGNSNKQIHYEFRFVSELSALLRTGSRYRKPLGWRGKFPSHTFFNTWLEQQFFKAIVLRQIDNNTKRHFPAPYIILDCCLNSWNEKNREDAQKYEVMSFSLAGMTHQSQSLIHIFSKSRSLKRFAVEFGAPWEPTKPLTTEEKTAKGLHKMPKVDGVVVLGTSTESVFMVYHALSRRNMEVVLMTTPGDKTDLHDLLNKVRAMWEPMLKRKKITGNEMEARLAAVQTLEIPSQLDTATKLFEESRYYGKAYVVVESSRHITGYAGYVIQALEKAGADACSMILSIGPSTQSLMGMSEEIRAADVSGSVNLDSNVCSLISEKSPIAEIACRSDSDIETVITNRRRCAILAQKIGKMPVVHFGDSMLTARLACSYFDTAIRLTRGSDAVTTMQSLDRMLMDAGFVMGPFAMMDSLGLVPCMRMARRILPGSALCSVLETLTTSVTVDGQAGKKSGRGFYVYNEKGRIRNGNQEVEKAGLKAGDHRKKKQKKTKTKHPSNREIVDVVNFAVAEVGLKIAIKEAEQGGDLESLLSMVDVVGTMALAMSPATGGPCFYGDAVGRKEVKTRLYSFARRIEAIANEELPGSPRASQYSADTTDAEPQNATAQWVRKLFNNEIDRAFYHDDHECHQRAVPYPLKHSVMSIWIQLSLIIALVVAFLTALVLVSVSDVRSDWQ